MMIILDPKEAKEFLKTMIDELEEQDTQELLDYVYEKYHEDKEDYESS